MGEAGFQQPVQVAKLLARQGLTLRRAHRLLNRLVAGEEVSMRLPSVADRKGLLKDCKGLGVFAEIHEAPESLMIEKIREKLALSQDAFASRFCLNPRTLENWEQGRNRKPLDPMTLTYLAIIERYPEIVDEILRTDSTRDLE